ncbi:MAG: arylesterase [Gammaproteobacteria bacterium]
MNKCWIIIGLVLITVFPAAACEHTADEKPVILVVGDSLSSAYGMDIEQGWVSLLERRLEENSMDYRIVNASISGDTTSGGLSRVKKALPELDPALVVIELGGNDGLRGLPLKSMTKNLQDMINLSAKQGTQPVLLGMRIPSNYGPRYTKEFHAIYADLSEQHAVPLVPFFMEGIALKPELMQSDGIHPNVDAQSVLLNNAWPAIEKGLELSCTSRR